MVLEKQGKSAEALSEYRLASSLDPNDAELRATAERVASVVAGQKDGGDEATMMAVALEQLDGKHDANAAIAQLRALLARNPGHYGANWQLARALDAAGRRDEAREAWMKMLELTEAAGDKANEKLVRDRLAQPH
jgi:Flp pilus assembly protein TadD